MEILGNTLLHRTHVSSAVKDRKGAGVTPAWCLDVSLSMCASVTNRRVSWVKSRGSWVKSCKHSLASSQILYVFELRLEIVT